MPPKEPTERTSIAAEQTLNDEIDRLQHELERTRHERHTDVSQGMHAALIKLTELQISNAEQNKLLNKVDEAIFGSEGLLIRADRLERDHARYAKIIWLILAAVITLFVQQVRKVLGG